MAGAVEHVALGPKLSFTGAQELVYAVAVYAALGSFVGLALSLLSQLPVVGSRFRDERRSLPAFASFEIAFFALLLVAYRVNEWGGMPPPESRAGLLLNGLFLVLAVALGFGLGSLLLRLAGEHPAAVQAQLHLDAPAFAAVPVLILIAWGGFAGIQALRDRALLGSGTGQAGNKPNVILLVIDALRKDHMSGYGYERRTTLALDHLMDEAVTFENAFAPSSWTVPSISSLFTGAGPATHGVVEWDSPLEEEWTTLAESLSRSGYVCGAFFANTIMDVVKNHDRGFHHRHPPPNPFWCFRMRTALERSAVRLLRRTYFRGDRLLGEVEGWIKKQRGQPFFAYVHLMEPHSPYHPPPPYDEMFYRDYDGPPMRLPPLELAPRDGVFRDWDALGSEEAALPEDRRQNMIALYDGEIAYIDSLIEGFLKRLEDMGLYEGTMIVVTADHGEEFYEHGGWFHGQSLFDELVRVPLIVKLPGDAGAGTRREDPVSGMDVMPSILSTLGIEVPSNVEGIDLFAASELQPPDRPIFAERPPYLYSVREGRWKLVRKHTRWTDYVYLFDLERDPAELDDVGNLNSQIRERLLERIQPRMSGWTREPRAEPGSLDEYQREKLKALGYVQ